MRTEGPWLDIEDGRRRSYTRRQKHLNLEIRDEEIENG